MKKFLFPSDGDIVSDIREKYGYEGDLARIFAENKKRSVSKWHHYIPLYERYLSQYRGTGFRFLEIGVAKGGSLQLWRKFFGPEAQIFGVDINENCRAFDGQDGQVRIGSQDDPEFLRSVVEEMGGIDVVLDDGSHMMPHIKKSLEVLFPLLEDGGLYLIEDLHTSYYRGFGGGRGNKDNFFNQIRDMIDDMHRWYYPGEPPHPEFEGKVSAIHVHDSMVVLEKNEGHPPTFSKVR